MAGSNSADLASWLLQGWVGRCNVADRLVWVVFSYVAIARMGGGCDSAARLVRVVYRPALRLPMYPGSLLR